MPEFYKDEARYEEWLRRHSDGFVFNHLGGREPGDNILHRASCPHLHRPSDEGVRTNVRKICADDQRELEATADAVQGRGAWKGCGICLERTSGGSFDGSVH
jgi:hypothetical protein